MILDRPLIGVNLLYVRPGYVGGTVRYAHELLKHLARIEKFRWKIYVQQGAFPVVDPLLAEIPKMEFRVIGSLAGRVLLEHLALPLIAQKDGIDLLFSPGFVSPLWGRFRKVVTIHDLYYKRFPEFVRPWQRRYWQMFVPMSIRAADAAIVVSDSTRDDVCTAFPESAKKVRRIYLGADSLPSSQSIPEQINGPFCLVVGNITPNKNIETIISALSILTERQQGIRLVVAGSDLFGFLRTAITQTRIKPDIELLEHVSDELLSRLYAQASCLIQASHYEGFGLPVVEAMAAGCPVIASNVAVLREVCGEAAMYFSPRSPQELADAIQELMATDGLRTCHIDRGREVSANFTWEKTAQETSDLFEKLL